jgi:hypothetical protein
LVAVLVPRLAAAAEVAWRCLQMHTEGGCLRSLVPTRPQFEFAVDMIASSPRSTAALLTKFL